MKTVKRLGGYGQNSSGGYFEPIPENLAKRFYATLEIAVETFFMQGLVSWTELNTMSMPDFFRVWNMARKSGWFEEK